MNLDEKPMKPGDLITEKVAGPRLASFEHKENVVKRQNIEDIKHPNRNYAQNHNKKKVYNAMSCFRAQTIFPTYVG